MSEKPESDEFEDEEPAEPVPGTEDVDLDQVTKDLDLAKRRGQKLGDPAWRRLERLREQKQTEEQSNLSYGHFGISNWNDSFSILP